MALNKHGVRADNHHAEPQIEYADCSQGWMKGGKVIADLMPDYLHPSGPGVHCRHVHPFVPIAFNI